MAWGYATFKTQVQVGFGVVIMDRGKAQQRRAIWSRDLPGDDGDFFITRLDMEDLIVPDWFKALRMESLE